MRAGIVLVEAEAESLVGDENDFVGARGEAHADELVVFLEDDGDDAVLAIVAEVVEGGFFHLARAGGEENEARVLAEGDVIAGFVGSALQAEHCGNFFLGFEVEHIADAASGRGARTFGEFIDAFDIDATSVGEEHQVVVRLDREEVFDEIIRFAFGGRFRFHAFQAFAASALESILTGRRAFHISAVGKRDDHRVVGDQVLDGDFAGLGKDRAFARGGVLAFDLVEFVLDDREHAHFAGEDVEQVLDVDEHAVVLGLHLVALHAGELVEAQFEDRVDLPLGEHIAVALDGGLRADEDAERFRGGGGKLISGEAFAGFVAVFRIADDLDEIVEMAEREQECFEQFRAFFGFAEKVARAADDHLAAVLDVGIDRFLE